MIEERTLGIAEARIGLAMLGCLLVTLGYVVIDRLVDVTQPVAANQAVGTEVQPTADAADQPLVTLQPDARAAR